MTEALSSQRVLRRTLAPLMALGVAAGVALAALPGSSTDVTPLSPAALDEARPVTAAADAALALARDAVAPLGGLRATLPGGTGDSTRLQLRRSDGTVVSDVVLSPPGAAAGWRVLSASTPDVAVRSPQAGASFDPPLSVAFRTSGDAQVTVTLLAKGRAAPLATWTEQVDGGTDWYAQLNYPVQAAGTRGLVVVSSQRDGHLDALEAVPVGLSSGS